MCVFCFVFLEQNQVKPTLAHPQQMVLLGGERAWGPGTQGAAGPWEIDSASLRFSFFVCTMGLISLPCRKILRF